MRRKATKPFELLVAFCFAMAACFAVQSYISTGRVPSPENRGNLLPTSEYQQYEKDVEAQLATRPASTLPTFVGKAYTFRPFFSIPSTYYALAFAALSVILLAIASRRDRRVKARAAALPRSPSRDRP